MPLDAGHREEVDETGTLSHRADLLGLEDADAPIPSQLEAAFDFVDLLPAFEGNAAGLPALESVPSEPLISLGSSNVWHTGFALMQPFQIMAVGKEVATSLDHAEWHCQFGKHATSPNDVPADECCMKYSTPDDLIDHYWTAHHPFQLPKFWYKCGGCAKWNEESLFCIQCGLVEGWEQEQWIFGNAVVVSSPSLFSV